MGSVRKRKSPLRPPNIETSEQEPIAISKPQVLQKPLLVHWNDLPPFLKDNEYIFSSYRPQSDSYTQCIRSLIYLHNQTGNIYTQVVAVICLGFAAKVLFPYAQSTIPPPQREDILVFGCFFLGTITCSTLSMTFHTITNHSPEVQRFWLNLDFLGLLAAASGAFVPGIWYTFSCIDKRFKVYSILLNLLAQSITAYVTLFVPVFRTPAWRPIRAGVFGLMGSLAFMPMIIGLFLYGVEEMTLQGGKYYIFAGLSYLSSAAFYALRWPEKWAPGQFDIWGHSHQWFHIMGFVGMLIHLRGFMEAFKYSTQVQTC